MNPKPELTNPPEASQHFKSLMTRIRTGEQAAARELIDGYGHHLLRVVRYRMHHSLRGQFDSHDFVQDVWASFFAKFRRRLSFQHPDELIAFLCTVAQNKVATVARQRLFAQKRNINREQSIDDSAAPYFTEPAAATPTPSQVAIGREAWEKLFNDQPPVYKRILLLLRDGLSPAQIRQELGVSEKTIGRLRKKLLESYLPS